MATDPARVVDGTIERLWRRYRDGGDPEARTLLLDRYIGLVHHSAREAARRGARDAELDELVSAGTVGLVQALEAFDPARGLAFSTYAVPRIRGAILDELRSRDWMPRSIRTRRRLLARARAELQQRLGHRPDDEQVAEALGIDLATYWRWLGETDSRVMLALHLSATPSEAGVDLADAIADPDTPDPGAALVRKESLAALRAGFAALPAKERLVLALYYYEELNQKQIGEVLHVSESRVSQIRSRALHRLRDLVASGGDPR
jgi:RNA polymerase sigma factor for flagellar operon FliA